MNILLKLWLFIYELECGLLWSMTIWLVTVKIPENICTSWANIPDGGLIYMYMFCVTGAKRSVDGSELMYARQKFVTVAKAFRLQAIDMVHIDFKGSVH